VSGYGRQFCAGSERIRANFPCRFGDSESISRCVGSAQHGAAGIGSAGRGKFHKEGRGNQEESL